jgi:hypothetical protein
MRNYSSANAFRTALESRLNGLAKEQGIDVQRLRRQVSFDRLLARIFASKRPGWYLKGGYALELRLPFPRSTKDVDLSVTSYELITLPSKEQSSALLENLREAAAIQLSDYFYFDVGNAVMDLDAAYGGCRYPVIANLAGRRFVQFHLDIGLGDAFIEPIDELLGQDFLSFAGLRPLTVPAISKEQHFAEKLHAYTMPRETPNSRVKDLVDMVVLLDTGLNKELVQKALALTFDRRKTHKLPINIDLPPANWQMQFTALATECGLSVTADEAAQRVEQFLT